MCILAILDANLFGEFDSPPLKLFKRWIVRKDGVLAYTNGGKYGKELGRSAKILKEFVAYRQSGRAILFTKEQIDMRSEYNRLELRSDDPHIIALAQASEALVLCSRDTKLIGDFKDRTILPDVNRHRRSVYPINRDQSYRREFLDRRRCKDSR